MRKLELFAAALLFVTSASAAKAGPPGVSLRLRGAPARSLAAAPTEQTCAVPLLAPVGFIDGSDGLAIATHPTARLDQQELHSLSLASLVQLRLDFRGPSLFVIGTPMRAGEQLTPTGWRPRWPFC